MALYMVFDVESVGLHGEGFAFGAVVIDERGNELAATRAQCRPEVAAGDDEAREWVKANVPRDAGASLCGTPAGVRAAFWMAWLGWRGRGARLAADVPWPVEARFLAACVDEHPDRRAEGPYPLIDVASVRLAAGLDPLATVERLPNELPAHDPLADARQSARLLVEAIEFLKGTP